MNTDNLTKELEINLIHWLTREIVVQTKNLTPRGIDGMQYLPEYKLQKLIFLVAEDWNLDITRVWYMYGGFICTQFSLREYANSLYQGLSDLSLAVINRIRVFLGESLMKDITSDIRDKYREVILKEGEKFLLDFYEERAPEEFQSMYRIFRRIHRYFSNYMHPDKTLDIEFRQLLGYDPWVDTYQFQKNIIEFQQESAKIVEENAFSSIVEGTRVLEKAFILVAWKREQREQISALDYSNLYDIEKEFENTIWKFIATYFAIPTARGLRKQEVQQHYIQIQQNCLRNLHEKVENLKTKSKNSNLYPKAAILKEYLDSNFKDIIEVLAGEDAK